MPAVADVAVLGAGFAGLACATALAEAGARVRVLEASGSLGGRGGSFCEPRTGEALDLGPHLLVGANHSVLALLERLGTRGRLIFQRSLAIEYRWPGGRRAHLRCARLPAPLHLVAGLLRFHPLSLAERAAALRVGRAARSLIHRPASIASSAPEASANSSAPRADETVSGWLGRLRQSSRARRLLWEPLAVAALNDSPDRSAASLFARVLAEMFSGRASQSVLGWPDGTLAELVEPAARWLAEHDGRLTRSRPVVGIEFEGARVRSVQLRGGERVEAGHYVSALPARSLERLLGSAPPELAPLRAVCQRFAGRTSPILSAYLWCSRPCLGTPFCALPEGPFPWIFERRARACIGSPRWILALTLSGARGWMERSDAAILEIARTQVERHFPGTSVCLEHARVVRQPVATFEPAPDLCSARPGPASPAANLWLAGDWTDTGLPSTLEGACRSGHTAADAVLAAGWARTQRRD